MNYQHLEYFLKAAEYQHYTRAAEHLHITQPALTKAILGIEEEIGAPLFMKRGRNIELTKYGTIFFDYARRSLEEINHGISAVKHQVNSDLNTVDLSALCSINTTFLPKKSAQFHLAYPDCSLNITFKYTTAIIKDVSNYNSTFGLCGEFDNESEYTSLEKILLYTEPVKFVISRNHPLAHKKSVEAAELKNQPFAVYNVSTNGTNRLLYELCDGAGFRPKTLTAAYNDYGLINEVISNQCISIVSYTFYKQFQSLGFTELHIATSIPLIQKIYLVWVRDANLSPVARGFRELLMSK